jgi:hypothetical protein
MNTERFLITGLGNQKIILGLPWLREHNPEINWKEGTLQWRRTTMEEVLDKEEHLNRPTNASDKVLLEWKTNSGLTRRKTWQQSWLLK